MKLKLVSMTIIFYLLNLNLNLKIFATQNLPIVPAYKYANIYFQCLILK